MHITRFKVNFFHIFPRIFISNTGYLGSRYKEADSNQLHIVEWNTLLRNRYSLDCNNIGCRSILGLLRGSIW